MVVTTRTPFPYPPTNSINFCPLEDLKWIDFLSPPNRNIKDPSTATFFYSKKNRPRVAIFQWSPWVGGVWNLINYNFHDPSPNWHTIDPWNKSPSTEKLINCNARSRSLIFKVSWWGDWKQLFRGNLILPWHKKDNLKHLTQKLPLPDEMAFSVNSKE